MSVYMNYYAVVRDLQCKLFDFRLKFCNSFLLLGPQQLSRLPFVIKSIFKSALQTIHCLLMLEFLLL